MDRKITLESPETPSSSEDTTSSKRLPKRHYSPSNRSKRTVHIERPKTALDSPDLKSFLLMTPEKQASTQSPFLCNSRCDSPGPGVRSSDRLQLQKHSQDSIIKSSHRTLETGSSQNVNLEFKNSGFLFDEEETEVAHELDGKCILSRSSKSEVQVDESPMRNLIKSVFAIPVLQKLQNAPSLEYASSAVIQVGQSICSLGSQVANVLFGQQDYAYSNDELTYNGYQFRTFGSLILASMSCPSSSNRNKIQLSVSVPNCGDSVLSGRSRDENVKIYVSEMKWILAVGHLGEMSAGFLEVRVPPDIQFNDIEVDGPRGCFINVHIPT